MLAFSRQKSGVFTPGFSRQGLKKCRHEIFYEMDPRICLPGESGNQILTWYQMSCNGMVTVRLRGAKIVVYPGLTVHFIHFRFRSKLWGHWSHPRKHEISNRQKHRQHLHQFDRQKAEASLNFHQNHRHQVYRKIFLNIRKDCRYYEIVKRKIDNSRCRHFYWRHRREYKLNAVRSTLSTLCRSTKSDASISEQFVERENVPLWSGTKYSGYLCTDHLNNGNIWIPNNLKFGFQTVQYSNGLFLCYVLCPVEMWNPDLYSHFIWVRVIYQRIA